MTTTSLSQIVLLIRCPLDYVEVDSQVAAVMALARPEIAGEYVTIETHQMKTIMHGLVAIETKTLPLESSRKATVSC